MKGLYENLLIGQFIFKLGYKMAESGKLNFSPNLLQQTPLDSTLSDFMARSKNRGFLLEFKKNWQGKYSERKKVKYDLVQNTPRLKKLSEKCQLLGYGMQKGDRPQPANLDIIFCNYVEGVSAQTDKELKVCWPMSVFVQLIIDEKIGGNPDEFCEYIKTLINLLKERYTKARGSSERVKAESIMNAIDSGVAIMNTGSQFFTVPFSSIFDVAVILGVPPAEERKEESEGNKPSPKLRLTMGQNREILRDIPRPDIRHYPGRSPGHERPSPDIER